MISISAQLDDAEGETTSEVLCKRKVVMWISHSESNLYTF